MKGVDICTLKFGGKKHPWAGLKIKVGNCEPPLKVVVDTLFYSVPKMDYFGSKSPKRWGLLPQTPVEI